MYYLGSDETLKEVNLKKKSILIMNINKQLQNSEYLLISLNYQI